jgi:hypothetical protein
MQDSPGPKRFDSPLIATGGAVARSPLTPEPSCKDEAEDPDEPEDDEEESFDLNPNDGEDE